jgi:hypothetical protein
MFKVSINLYNDLFIQYDIYDTKSNIIFFRFKKSHYVTGMKIQEIQCTTEWEEYKELLPEIFIGLKEHKEYDYSILSKVIREVKLTNLGII